MTSPARLPAPLIPLNTSVIKFDSVGGKGANLVALANAGFEVPNAFLIPTSAYREFVNGNQLTDRISRILAANDPNNPDDLETASGQIRKEFSAGEVSTGFLSSLGVGRRWLGGGPVAVRSSATAEDLPEMSFAGQQDTFLNVVGDRALAEAVVKCWSSLWTARAIGYRARNAIAHTEIALSVVVQQMVPSQASGVLFTANPLTGRRSEMVIDATLGLGEALVSGQVEPDHYVVDTDKGKIAKKTLGRKDVVIQGEAGGGVRTERRTAGDEQAIPDEIILQLANTGSQIEAHFNFPQDIEWAWADEKLYILQSRPITSLFPIPEGPDTDHAQVYFSFGAVQGLLAPMTPLGQDAIRLIFAGGSSLLGFDRTYKTQGVLYLAGERLWGNFTAVIHHPIGARLAPKVFPGIEPGSINALHTILNDPDIGAGSGQIRIGTFRRIGKFMVRLFRKIFYFARDPEVKAAEIREDYEAEVKNFKEKYAASDGEQISLEKGIEMYRQIYQSFIYVIPNVATGAAAGLLPLLILNRLSNHLTGSNQLALETTRGLPNNVTTEMDLALWETAKKIRSDSESLVTMASSPAQDLADAYLKGDLPETAQEAITAFMNDYGFRGLGEIDIGRPRWRENPTQIMQTLQSYLKITDASKAPDTIFQRGEKESQAAIAALETAARKTFAGKVKARVIRATARRVRALAGLRESPKYYIVKKMGIIRQALQDCGTRLAQEGKLEQANDLFYLHLDELEGFANGDQGNWQALIRERRETFEREMRRRQVPRMMISDGRVFYEGMGSAELEGDALQGSPVSPGVVEGTARVVFDPHEAEFSPGEILVCPGTDPAWTPLFLAAGGLVMETGGMMTHGAIVAREYGIPAVVGIDRATERIRTGDRIRVNGSTGLIEWVDYVHQKLSRSS
jgi:pyruvate,water dikinase